MVDLRRCLRLRLEARPARLPRVARFESPSRGFVVVGRAEQQSGDELQSVRAGWPPHRAQNDRRNLLGHRGNSRMPRLTVYAGALVL